jgi:uncharacterized protein
MCPDSTLFTKLLEPLPFFDLFVFIQPKLDLTLDQYDALKKSLWMGYGTTSWEDLRRVCSLLWVRPSDNNNHQKKFDSEFSAYRQRIIDSLPKNLSISAKDSSFDRSKATVSPVLPSLPLRLVPIADQPSEVKAATRVQTSISTNQSFRQELKFPPVDLPISLSQVRENWRLLRQVDRWGIAEEIDVEKTVAEISRVGFVGDVVLRPILRQRSELVVLVDDGDQMVPYLPAVAPLFTAITNNWVCPAEIYRFIGYPAWFLSKWLDPSCSVVVSELLARLHRSNTVVMVVSEMGAATGEWSAERLKGTRDFLRRWQLCTRQILWINPVPRDRWRGTMAAEIQKDLGGKMLWVGDMGSREMQSLLRSRRR